VCHKSSGYPSEMSDEQWAIIKAMDINRHWGPGRPMRLEVRAVINGILYILRTGCQWRYLPEEYPNHNSVYYYFILSRT
jgi:putative transposase